MRNLLQKLPFSLITTLLLLFFAFSILINSDFSFDQDLGRHIKLGEIILQTGSIPTTNLFSYTYPDFLFVNHHWLFEVSSYLGMKAVGIDGLLLFKIIVILTTVFITLKISHTSSLLTLPVGFIFFHLLSERTDFRPEIFSFLFTALTLYLLNKFASGNKKALLFLPLIQLLWINIHIYFIVGFVLQGIYLIHLVYGRKATQAKLILGCILVSLLISLLNPNFYNGLIYPLTIFNNYGYSIVENQTIFTLESINFHNPNFIYFKISAGIILIFSLISLVKKNLSIKTFLLLLTGVGLATLHIRSFPYLVLISFSALAKHLPIIKINNIILILYLISAGYLVYESLNLLSGNSYLINNSSQRAKLGAPEHIKGATDFLINNNLPQPIYNNFDVGSYISYRGYPKYKVFVDGRPEAYPKEFFQTKYIPSQSDPLVFQKLSDKYGFQTIIFSHTDQTPWAQTFLQNIVKNPQWEIVYLDDFMIILTLKNVVEQLKLEPVNLQKIDVIKYRFDSHIPYLRLAIFLDKIGSYEASQKFLLQAKRLNPNI